MGENTYYLIYLNKTITLKCIVNKLQDALHAIIR